MSGHGARQPSLIMPQWRAQVCLQFSVAGRPESAEPEQTHLATCSRIACRASDHPADQVKRLRTSGNWYKIFNLVDKARATITCSCFGDCVIAEQDDGIPSMGSMCFCFVFVPDDGRQTPGSTAKPSPPNMLRNLEQLQDPAVKMTKQVACGV